MRYCVLVRVLTWVPRRAGMHEVVVDEPDAHMAMEAARRLIEAVPANRNAQISVHGATQVPPTTPLTEIHFTNTPLADFQSRGPALEGEQNIMDHREPDRPRMFVRKRGRPPKAPPDAA